MNTSSRILAFVVVVIAAGIFVLFSPLFSPTGFDTFQIGTATFNVIFTGTVVDIVKSDFPDPVLQGGTLNYSILVNVTGNASNVTVFDIYPGDIAFVSSEPPPSSGNDTWNLGNLTNTSFQINITVTVSPTFTGFLINNATVFYNQPNGSAQNASDIEVTTVIAPTPPPSGGQGGGSGGAGMGCAPYNAIQRRIDGQTITFYTCCADEDCERIWGLTGYYCGRSNLMLAASVCLPKAQKEQPALPRGSCPVERTCGTICCDVGQLCYNSKCIIQRQQELLVPAQPPSEGGFIILGVQETSILWLLLLIILAIVLLIILAILASLNKEKKKKRRKK